MMHKEIAELISEVKKIRGDQDKIQAYLKTIAENTAPAGSQAEEQTGT